jgi:hypothetical protein
MKSKFIYTTIVILAMAISLVQGQTSKEDVRRSAQEQAAYEKTIPVNPAKISVQPQTDPRMDAAQTTAPPTNWKPSVTVDERNQAQPVLPSKPVINTTNVPSPSATQPQPTQVKVENRGNMKGSNTQPKPDNAVKPVSRRDMKGPATQPEPQKSR